MPPVIKTLVVDDEPIARRTLCDELESIREIDVIGEAESGSAALRQIANLQPDLVFLDIQMPGLGGFEVIRRLGGAHLPVVVIVTAFEQHAIEAFEAGAADYLVKPVSPERLQKALERAKSLIGKPREIALDLMKIACTAEPAGEARQQKLIGRVGRDYFLLDIDEVLALQVERELVWIVTSQRRFHAAQSLKAIEITLQPSFQRVHRNAIVNVNHIRTLTALTGSRWMLTLSNQQKLVVSKRRAHHIRRLLQG
jgi:two-component system LytT family response regulator